MWATRELPKAAMGDEGGGEKERGRKRTGGLAGRGRLSGSHTGKGLLRSGHSEGAWVGTRDQASIDRLQGC